MKTIHVVAAIIIRNEKVLATQRGHGEFAGGWEFPGGKIEEGETPEKALAREIKEELKAEIGIGEKFLTVHYNYPKFHLEMDCFFCEVTDEKFTLVVHQDAKWLSKADLDSVNWLPADIEIIQALKDVLK